MRAFSCWQAVPKRKIRWIDDTLCRVEGYRVTQGFSMEWLRPFMIFLRVGTGVPWDNVPSLIHSTDVVSAAGS